MGRLRAREARRQRAREARRLRAREARRLREGGREAERGIQEG